MQKEIDDLKTELEQLEKELNGELKIPDGIFKSDNIIKPNNAHKGIYEKINDKTTPDDTKKTSPLEQEKLDNTITKEDLKKTGMQAVRSLGKGYNVFGEYGSLTATKAPVFNFDKILEYNWIQEKNLGSDIHQNTIISESLQEYQTEMTNKAKIGGSYKCFSGSVETNFGKTTGQSKFKYHATHMYEKRLNGFYIYYPDSSKYRECLTESAKKAIDTAPIDQLFGDYGHYVLMGMITGGRVDINTTTDKSTVYGKEDFALKVKAGFNALIASGNAENEYKKSTAYKNFADKSDINLHIVGNINSVYLKDFLEGSDKLTEWEKNIESHATMIDFNDMHRPLIPIWELAGTEKRKNQIKSEFEKIAGDINKKIPGVAPETKNYLYGIRLGHDNDSMQKAIKKSLDDNDDKNKGSTRYTVLTWELLSTVESRDAKKDIADLNHGVEVDKRDYIVLDLGWSDKKEIDLTKYVPKYLYFPNGYKLFPITDICIYQGNENTKNADINFNHSGNAQWFRLGKDLNTNAGGNYLYLMWTEDKSRPPITNLALCVEDNNGGPNEKFPGWEVVRFANSNIPANLNLGVVQTEGANKNKSAPNIYLVMRREH